MKLNFFTIQSVFMFLFTVAAIAKPGVEFVEPDHAAGSSKAVIVDAAPLAHTTQVLPVNGKGEVVGKGDIEKQAEQVLSNLDRMLKQAKSSLNDSVKLNVYLRSSGLSDQVSNVLARKFRGKNPPAVTWVAGEMIHPDILVAMDAVAVSKIRLKGHSPVHFKARDSRFADVSVLPQGEVVYVAGLAAKGDLASATRETMKQIEAAIIHLGLTRRDIVQLKAFLLPMRDAGQVKEEIGRFFEGMDVPAIILVDWVSSSVPVEIEAIVAAPPANAESTVTYHTPPGIKASPVYSRLARVHGGKRIYISGLYGESAVAENDVNEIYAEFDRLLKLAGSSRDHMAKATYYYSDPQSNARLDAFRPSYYNPQTPPAASKARVKEVGRRRKGIVIDMIAVTR